MGEKLHFQPEFRSLNGGAACMAPDHSPGSRTHSVLPSPPADRSASEILWKMLMPRSERSAWLLVGWRLGI